MKGLGLPITENTNQYLTNDDTADFQVFNSSKPGRITSLFVFPAVRERFLEQRFNISN